MKLHSFQELNSSMPGKMLAFRVIPGKNKFVRTVTEEQLLTQKITNAYISNIKAMREAIDKYLGYSLPISSAERLRSAYVAVTQGVDKIAVQRIIWGIA
jgi:hypothetical protein